MKDMRDVAGLVKFASESVVYALNQLKGDRFRTLLSLTGISIGIFTIVSTLTLVDSLQRSITESFEEFGSDVAFIEQMPIEPDLNEDGVFRWWEYASRPQMSYDEFKYVKDNIRQDIKLAYAAHLSHPVSYRNNTSSEGETIGVDGDWNLDIREDIYAGRKFTAPELKDGADVAMIGWKVAERLFDDEDASKLDALNKDIKVAGRMLKVIGIFDKSGDSMVSLTDVDEVVVIPVGCAMKLDNLASARCTITTSAKGDEELMIRQLIREHRRLKPSEEDNFAVNRLSFVIEQLGGIFRLANILGWIIGGFSLLVGGFGIANIMFVAVSERVAEIGLQKALGARRSFIVSGFLTESAVLTIAGGTIGIMLTAMAVSIIPSGMISVTLSLSNIIKGLLISTVTGIIAGLAPALSAASLNPVEALRK